jgi:hypothetical protein
LPLSYSPLTSIIVTAFLSACMNVVISDWRGRPSRHDLRAA